MYFNNDQVMTRYLSSAFLGHITTEDLKLRFEGATQNIDTKRMYRFQWIGTMSTRKC